MKYLEEVLLHFERIEYYHEHYGRSGYERAKYHLARIADYYSKSADTDDALVISVLHKRAANLLATLKEREQRFVKESTVSEKLAEASPAAGADLLSQLTTVGCCEETTAPAG